MRRVHSIILLALISGPSSAQGGREFGAARFEAPAGFTLDARPTMLTFSRARGRELCMIAVYGAERSAPELADAFKASWTLVFPAGAYRRRDMPTMSVRTSPQGDRHGAGEGDLEDNNGNRFFARMFVFPLSTDEGGRRVPRSQTIVWIGNGREALTGCESEWNTFFSSLRFRGASATAEAGNASTPSVGASPGPNQPPPAPAPTPASPSGPQSFENLEFTLPGGWSSSRTGGALVLKPVPANPVEQVEVWLLGGRRIASSLPNEFPTAWNDLAARFRLGLMRSVNGGSYDVEDVATAFAGWEYLRGVGAMKPPGGGQITVVLYLIKNGERAEQVAILSKDFRDNASGGGVMVSSLDNPVWRRDIGAILSRLRVPNQVAAHIPPARLATGAVGGVWEGITMSFGSLKTTYAVFFENGIVFLGPGFPTSGLRDIDPAALQFNYRRYWGTYTFANGQGVLTMPYGKVPVRATATGLTLTTNQTDHRFVRRYSLAGIKPDGAYCLAGGECLTFTSAGRFEDTGAARVLEHQTYAFPETPARGSGRYEFVDYTLILRYDSGKEIRIAAPGSLDPVSASPSEITLSFNDDALKKR